MCMIGVSAMISLGSLAPKRQVPEVWYTSGACQEPINWRTCLFPTILVRKQLSSASNWGWDHSLSPRLWSSMSKTVETLLHATSISKRVWS